MRKFLAIFALASVSLLAVSALAKEFYWPMFMPAINNAPRTVVSAGRVWMDRNLGASRVATSPTDSAGYGDLYQWGRLTDGHQNRTSPTTVLISTTDVPRHGHFIIAALDWRNPHNSNLWQGVYGVNNPCPSGFRLPTAEEWEIERASWSSNDAAGAFASPLKLVLAGYRKSADGTLSNVDTRAGYWSSSVKNGLFPSSYFLNFSVDSASVSSFFRGSGFSVRCIME